MIGAANFNDVLVAICTLAGIVFGGMLKLALSMRRVRNENKAQHGTVGEALARVETKVDLTHEGVRDVAGRLDDHINGPHHQRPVIVNPRHNTDGNSAA
jgi:hypothetical protein